MRTPRRPRRLLFLPLLTLVLAGGLLLVGVLNASASKVATRPMQTSYSGTSSGSLANTGSNETLVLVGSGLVLVLVGTAGALFGRRLRTPLSLDS